MLPIACVSERDYHSGEWRRQFQARGIPVLIGGNKFSENGLIDMKRILMSFDCVTTNAFGSHIAYAAHCGARVCVDGPFCEWEAGRSSEAQRVYPQLAGTLVELQSEERLRREFPFLFKAPRDAEPCQEWGDAQIGLDQKRSAEALKNLFGWKAG